MDLLVKNNHLFVRDKKLKCAVGHNGLTNDKKEGDLSTPTGVFSFNKIYYRADKLGKIKFAIDSSIIQENDGWCDDQNSKLYNQYIQFPFKESAEHLYRSDDIYDIVCVLDYNTSPIIPGKGSAIFLHIARPNFVGTEGCIAIEKEELLQITANLTNESRIVIEY